MYAKRSGAAAVPTAAARSGCSNGSAIVDAKLFKNILRVFILLLVIRTRLEYLSKIFHQFRRELAN